MTQGTVEVLGGVAWSVSAVGQIIDFLLTNQGLSKGMKEVGLINRYFTKNLPLATFLEAMATLVIFGVLDTHNPVYGLAFAAPLAAAIWVNNIRSLKLLGKI